MTLGRPLRPASLLSAVALLALAASAGADRPPVAPPPPPPLAAASVEPKAAPQPPAAAPRAAGAVVVGLGDSSAAKSLAREVYREDGLRPPIDERMARILSGDTPTGDLSTREKDVRDVRASLEKQLDPATEALFRRGLGSLGGDVGAELVVAVFGVGKDARARVLRVGTARWEGVELVPLEENGAISWPRAGRTIGALVTPPPPVAKKDAVEPPKKKDEKRQEFWQSPWFWIGGGVLLAAGAGVLIGSQVASSDSSKVHVLGKISP